MGLNLCLPEEGCLVDLCGLCVLCICRVSVCVSVPHKGLCSVFIEQQRERHVGKEWGSLQKHLAVLQTLVFRFHKWLLSDFMVGLRSSFQRLYVILSPNETYSLFCVRGFQEYIT